MSWEYPTQEQDSLRGEEEDTRKPHMQVQWVETGKRWDGRCCSCCCFWRRAGTRPESRPGVVTGADRACPCTCHLSAVLSTSTSTGTQYINSATPQPRQGNYQGRNTRFTAPFYCFSYQRGIRFTTSLCGGRAAVSWCVPVNGDLTGKRGTHAPTACNVSHGMTGFSFVQPMLVSFGPLFFYSRW
jgi:hypothetical protein